MSKTGSCAYFAFPFPKIIEHYFVLLYFMVTGLPFYAVGPRTHQSKLMFL